MLVSMVIVIFGCIVFLYALLKLVRLVLGNLSEEQPYKVVRVLSSILLFAIIIINVPIYIIQNTTVYEIITDDGVEIDSSEYVLFGEATYKNVKDEDILLIQSDGDKYINDSLQDVVIHTLDYGAPIRPSFDVVIPVGKVYLDVNGSLDIEYTVKNYNDIKGQDKGGYHGYLLPLSALPKNYKLKRK